MSSSLLWISFIWTLVSKYYISNDRSNSFQLWYKLENCVGAQKLGKLVLETDLNTIHGLAAQTGLCQGAFPTCHRFDENCTGKFIAWQYVIRLKFVKNPENWHPSHRQKVCKSRYFRIQNLKLWQDYFRHDSVIQFIMAPGQWRNITPQIVNKQHYKKMYHFILGEFYRGSRSTVLITWFKVRCQITLNNIC